MNQCSGALLVLAATLAKAEPEEYQFNAREACRQAVAGAYLDVYGERDRLTQALQFLSDLQTRPASFCRGQTYQQRG